MTAHRSNPPDDVEEIVEVIEPAEAEDDVERDPIGMPGGGPQSG